MSRLRTQYQNIWIISYLQENFRHVSWYVTRELHLWTAPFQADSILRLTDHLCRLPIKSPKWVCFRRCLPSAVSYQIEKANIVHMHCVHYSIRQSRVVWKLHQMALTSSEETPLLSSDRDVDREEVYKRFAPARKRGILAIVSLTGLVPRTCI